MGQLKNILSAFWLLSVGLILVLMSTHTYAQNHNEAAKLDIGDIVPPLQVTQWIKGSSLQGFEIGKVYALEYWATWCRPCKAAMPHLSDIARKYREQVTIIGIDVDEMKSTSIQDVKAFVDSMGSQMDYVVASQDSIMAAEWFKASGEVGIPQTFVVNRDGILAWVGHPSKLEEVLTEVLRGTWDVSSAKSKRNLNKHLAILDDSLNYELMNYGKRPDLVLRAIDKIIKDEPRLKYARFIASHTFYSLLKTDEDKAYQYGKQVLVNPVYEEPAYSVIIGAIEWYSDKLPLSAKIYNLGAEACQVEIDYTVYPQLVNMSRRYSKMAEWYWRAEDKSKAIESQQKAIEELKSKKGVHDAALATLESRLQYYRKK